MTHGTAYGYKVGCRCPQCTVAKSDQQRRWRLRQRPPVPFVISNADLLVTGRRP